MALLGKGKRIKRKLQVSWQNQVSTWRLINACHCQRHSLGKFSITDVIQ